jgi:hypothetical protein
MHNILVSEAVWGAIASRIKNGETEDSVLRRMFKLPPEIACSNGAKFSSVDTKYFSPDLLPAKADPQNYHGSHVIRVKLKRRISGPRTIIATRRMSTEVRRNQLHVSFHVGPACSWELPPPYDKAAIRVVRDKAVIFAGENGATKGQIMAVMKALTSAGFYLRK